MSACACVGSSRSSREPDDHAEGLQVDEDLVDVFPSEGDKQRADDR